MAGIGGPMHKVRCIKDCNYPLDENRTVRYRAGHEYMVNDDVLAYANHPSRGPMMEEIGSVKVEPRFPAFAPRPKSEEEDDSEPKRLIPPGWSK